MAAILVFIRGDDAGQEVKKNVSLALREASHDLILDGEDNRIKSQKQFNPLWCEAEERSAAPPCIVHSADKPPALEVLHHPLSTGKINPDPLSEAVFINRGSVMKRCKHRRLN
jgi:hypothetical protein